MLMLLWLLLLFCARFAIVVAAVFRAGIVSAKDAKAERSAAQHRVSELELLLAQARAGAATTVGVATAMARTADPGVVVRGGGARRFREKRQGKKAY